MLLAQVSVIELVVLLVVGLFLAVVAATVLQHFNLWFQAHMTGTPVSLPRIIGMRYRKVNPKTVVQSLIVAKQAGIQLSVDEVEQAYLQGADLPKITMALVRAKKEGRDYTFQQLVEAKLGEAENRYGEESVDVLRKTTPKCVVSSEGWTLRECGGFGELVVAYSEGADRTLRIWLGVSQRRVFLDDTSWQWNESRDPESVVPVTERGRIIQRVKAGLRLLWSAKYEIDSTHCEINAGLREPDLKERYLVELQDTRTVRVVHEEKTVTLSFIMTDSYRVEMQLRDLSHWDHPNKSTPLEPVEIAWAMQLLANLFAKRGCTLFVHK